MRKYIGIHLAFTDFFVIILPILNPRPRVFGGLHIDHDYTEQYKEPRHGEADSVNREVTNQFGAIQGLVLNVYIDSVYRKIFT